jgi:uncharacterized membrane protein YagU involved in acid resistance
MAQSVEESPVESSTEIASGREFVNRRAVSSAVVAGVAGGVVFGGLLQSMGMLPVVASLYGLEGLAWGWVAHIVHSVVFALVFAGIVTGTGLRKYAGDVTADVGLGAAYGAVLWFVAAAIAMPLWMSAVGLDAPAVPNLDVASLGGHLLYGVVLGAVFAVAYRR